jgi:hypothetical protein
MEICGVWSGVTWLLLAVVETNSSRSRLVDADTTADLQQTAVKDNVIATSV